MAATTLHAILVLGVALVAGCAVPDLPTLAEPPPPVYQTERFNVESSHAKRYPGRLRRARLPRIRAVRRQGPRPARRLRRQKPVQRRILYAMFRMGLAFSAQPPPAPSR
jgi:hypothetical protein